MPRGKTCSSPWILSGNSYINSKESPLSNSFPHFYSETSILTSEMAQQQKYNKLADKHVLIIGGTSGNPLLFPHSIQEHEADRDGKGIGYGVAEALIESSANITISSSSPDRVKTAISSLQDSYPSAKTSIKGFACDLSKPTLEQDLEALFEKTGKVDHIVFTAGDRLATTSLAESTLESIQRAGQIRFFAPLLVAKVGRKYLTGGAQSSIVLTTGSVADRPVPNVSLHIFPPLQGEGGAEEG